MGLNYFGDDGVVSQTKVVPIGGGFHVVIGQMSGEQDDECDAILQNGKPAETKIVNRAGQATQETTMTQEFIRYRNAVVLRGIRSWDLKQAGVIAPIDEAHVGMLSSGDRNKLFVEIKTFNSAMDATTQGN